MDSVEARILRDNIIIELKVMADVAFNEETAIDSDGTDQAQREGIEQAIDVVVKNFEQYL